MPKAVPGEQMIKEGDLAESLKEIDRKRTGDTILRDTGEKGWLSIEFLGFVADDSQPSLFRKWTSVLSAIRSDGETIGVRLNVLQADGPLRFGDELQRALGVLETYRNCACVAKQPCPTHKEPQE